MAGTYYVDDGGDNSDGLTWAKAFTSINSLLAEPITLDADTIVYFGHDHVCQAANIANLTITGPASGLPCKFISVTQGSDPVEYQASTTAQIDTSEGAYNLTFDGSFALYGISCKSGADIKLFSDSNEKFYTKDCRFDIGTAQLYIPGDNATLSIIDTTIVMAETNSVNAPIYLYYPGKVNIIGATFVNAGFRTGTIFTSTVYIIALNVSDTDFSGFNNVTECELINNANIGASAIFNNCKTKASIVYSLGTPVHGRLEIYNCANVDDPTFINIVDYSGTLLSSTAIYRTGGASIETVSTAWNIVTTANCTDATPFITPWIYGTIDSTGSKTFTLYITNDTADLTNREVFLEVEYFGTENIATWTRATDQVADIVATAANQADDVASEWIGLNDAEQGLADYMQSLAVTATVNETGQYRARVVVAKASIAAGSYFYIDPKVTVS